MTVVYEKPWINSANNRREIMTVIEDGLMYYATPAMIKAEWAIQLTKVFGTQKEAIDYIDNLYALVNCPPCQVE